MAPPRVADHVTNHFKGTRVQVFQQACRFTSVFSNRHQRDVVAAMHTLHFAPLEQLDAVTCSDVRIDVALAKHVSPGF